MVPSMLCLFIDFQCYEREYTAYWSEMLSMISFVTKLETDSETDKLSPLSIEDSLLPSAESVH